MAELLEHSANGPSSEFFQVAMAVLMELREGQISIEQKIEIRQQQVDNIERKLDEHNRVSNERHGQILGAFPSQDVDAHRRYHQSVIEWREARNQLVKDCLTHAAKTGFIASGAWLLYAVWLLIKHELSR